MEKYAEYKDSGVDWLGQIPAGWNLSSLRSIFEFRNEKNDPVITEDILSLSIANGVTPYSDQNRGGNKAKNDLTAYKIARPGDIVINSMNVIVGAVGLSKYFGAISPVYYAISPRNKDAEIGFFEYVFHNASFQRGLLRLGKGILIKKGESGKLNTIRMKISVNDLKLVKLPLPPLPEQTAIARFLDDKVGKINRLVGIKRRQIALLGIRKQILIQNAVTKGLNPTAPMKNSGIDWIGEIPAHWEVKRVKYLLNTRGGYAFESSSFTDEGIQLIKIGNLYQSVLSLDRQPTFLDKIFAKKLPNFVAHKGDLLMSLTGTLGKRDYGFAVLIELDRVFMINQRVLILKPKKGVFTRYAKYLLQSERYLSQIYRLPAGTKQANLSEAQVLAPKVALPNISEQKIVVAFIKTQERKINTAIAIKQFQITKLNEYKTTLINAAVTGKIKVPSTPVDEAMGTRQVKS